MGDSIGDMLQKATELAISENHELALDKFEQVVSIDPENANAWYCRGVSLSRLNKISEAIASFEKSDKFFPNHGPTLANLATLLEKEDPERASDLARAALISFPDNEKLKQISSYPESNEFPNKVFVSAKPILEEEFDYKDSHIEIGITQNEKMSNAQDLTSTGEHSRAVSIWKGLLEDTPNSPEVWRGLGDALISAGYPDRAEQCRIKADSLSVSKNDYSEAEVEDIDATEALLQAVEDSQSLQQEEPVIGDLEEAAGWYNMGINLLTEGKNDEAISSFEKAIGGCPRDETSLKVKAQNGRGNALYNSGRYSESIVAYHTAISMDPESVSGRTLFNMGSSYAAVEMFDDAVKCFSQALERGLEKDEVEVCEKHISRCRMLSREQAKRQSRLSR
ncbi:MAG: hypothetical protein CMB67_00660 [Euryarchaeota archaeon]|mgnify:CR=1 FL=1|nr:hypothetical protein [Euryarchaeota archaeon]